MGRYPRSRPGPVRGELARGRSGTPPRPARDPIGARNVPCVNKFSLGFRFAFRSRNQVFPTHTRPFPLMHPERRGRGLWRSGDPPATPRPLRDAWANPRRNKERHGASSRPTRTSWVRPQRWAPTAGPGPPPRWVRLLTWSALFALPPLLPPRAGALPSRDGPGAHAAPSAGLFPPPLPRRLSQGRDAGEWNRRDRTRV